MSKLQVSSESGVLRKALVHTPGGELSMVAPSRLRDFLFSDILYEKGAREEHLTLVRVLQEIFDIEVFQFTTLLEEALSSSDPLDKLRLVEGVSALEGLYAEDAIKLKAAFEDESQNDASYLARLLITGKLVGSDISVSDFIRHNLYQLQPIPNLMFVRDLAAVIGQEMFVGWNSQKVRRRENLLWRFILQHASIGQDITWHNWMMEDESSSPCYLEGGNILQPRPNILLIGHGVRTNSSAVERLIRHLQNVVKDICYLFVIMLPDYIPHLDAVLSAISPFEYVAFPPAVKGHSQYSVDVLQVVLQQGKQPKTQVVDLLDSLQSTIGEPLDIIPCGGSDTVTQKREYWWGGASLLAVSPGKIISYNSPENTLNELSKRGYKIIQATDALSNPDSIRSCERCVITLRGLELTRARGGPRSLVMPLVREGV